MLTSFWHFRFCGWIYCRWTVGKGKVKRVMGKHRNKLVWILVFVLTLCSCNGNIRSEKGEATAKEKTRIVILSPYTESNTDAITEYFRLAIDQAREAFPDCEIIHDTINTETYKNKVKIHMAADEPVDIFFTWTGGFLDPFIRKGKVLSLNDYVADEENVMQLTGMQNEEMRRGEDIYGLTFVNWYGTLYCNEEIFEQFSLEVPQTWDEFLYVSSKLRRNGVEPIACGLMDIWPGHLYINQLMLQLAGAEMYNGIADKKVECDEAVMKEVGTYITQLINAGAFHSNALRMSNDASITTFIEGKAAMLYNGSNISHQLTGSPVDGHVRAVPLPRVEECRYPRDYLGKTSTGICVSAGTKNPQKAVAVALFIARQVAVNDGSLVTWDIPDQDRKMTDVDEQILSYTRMADGWGNNYDVELESRDAQDYLGAVLKLYTKESDAGQFAREAADILNR